MVVTGANAGIGLEVVRQLAAQTPALRVIGTARSEAKATAALDALGRPENVRFGVLDVTSDESGIYSRVLIYGMKRSEEEIRNSICNLTRKSQNKWQSLSRTNWLKNKSMCCCKTQVCCFRRLRHAKLRTRLLTPICAACCVFREPLSRISHPTLALSLSQVVLASSPMHTALNVAAPFVQQTLSKV